MRTQLVPPFVEQRILYPQETTELSDGTRYTPFTGGGMAGLKCERPASRCIYIYFNPSDHTDDDVPNVFVYQGATANPNDDPPAHHYVIWDEPTARDDTLARRAPAATHATTQHQTPDRVNTGAATAGANRVSVA